MAPVAILSTRQDPISLIYSVYFQPYLHAVLGSRVKTNSQRKMWPRLRFTVFIESVQVETINKTQFLR